MTALVKHRDLLSAGLALGFVAFVLASVALKTLTHTADARPNAPVTAIADKPATEPAPANR